jgi:hypothetical protein
VVVHDIDVHGIRVADPLQLGLKVGEVGGQDARVDAALGHAGFLVGLMKWWFWLVVRLAAGLGQYRPAFRLSCG